MSDPSNETPPPGAKYSLETFSTSKKLEIESLWALSSFALTLEGPHSTHF